MCVWCDNPTMKNKLAYWWSGDEIEDGLTHIIEEETVLCRGRKEAVAAITKKIVDSCIKQVKSKKYYNAIRAEVSKKCRRLEDNETSSKEYFALMRARRRFSK